MEQEFPAEVWINIHSFLGIKDGLNMANFLDTKRADHEQLLLYFLSSTIRELRESTDKILRRMDQMLKKIQ